MRSLLLEIVCACVASLTLAACLKPSQDEIIPMNYAPEDAAPSGDGGAPAD